MLSVGAVTSGGRWVELEGSGARPCTAATGRSALESLAVAAYLIFRANAGTGGLRILLATAALGLTGGGGAREGRCLCCEVSTALPWLCFCKPSFFAKAGTGGDATLGGAAATRLFSIIVVVLC